MKSIHAAIVIASGLLLALWWSVAPPRSAPAAAAPVEHLRAHQCPANSRLEGKLCTCPEGTSWSGSSCVESWSSGPRRSTRGPTNLPGTPRAGGMVKIERTVGDFTGTGNIAIIEAVGESSVTIIEGDYRSGSMTRRSASGKDLQEAARKLGIVGYLTP